MWGEEERRKRKGEGVGGPKYRGGWARQESPQEEEDLEEEQSESEADAQSLPSDWTQPAGRNKGGAERRPTRQQRSKRRRKAAKRREEKRKGKWKLKPRFFLTTPLKLSC